MGRERLEATPTQELITQILPRQERRPQQILDLVTIMDRMQLFLALERLLERAFIITERMREVWMHLQ